MEKKKKPVIYNKYSYICPRLYFYYYYYYYSYTTARVGHCSRDEKLRLKRTCQNIYIYTVRMNKL